MQKMFKQMLIQNKADGVKTSINIAGKGEPLLLIHGYPQTHLCWHKIAPSLAEKYTVICPDVRGNGLSDKPKGLENHENYSKRTLASDMIAVMDHLGFDTFKVVGHDRGGRITHRLCLDYPDRVAKAALLDIIPTTTFYETVNDAVARSYFHWFFLIQKYPLPERMIEGASKTVLHAGLSIRNGGVESIEPDILKAFEENLENPDVIHGTCEDYRAGATIDIEHEKADGDKKIQCPLLVLWGNLGPMGQLYDILDIWKTKAVDVSGRGLECGHYLPEEKPEEVLSELNQFL